MIEERASAFKRRVINSFVLANWAESYSRAWNKHACIVAGIISAGPQPASSVKTSHADRPSLRETAAATAPRMRSVSPTTSTKVRAIAANGGSSLCMGMQESIADQVQTLRLCPEGCRRARWPRQNGPEASRLAHGIEGAAVFGQLGAAGDEESKTAAATCRALVTCNAVFSNPEWGFTGLQPVLRVNVLRSDCQQIIAHPSERNASWMSARLSYRTRRRRN
jgi:hypothetical protein